MNRITLFDGNFNGQNLTKYACNLARLLLLCGSYWLLSLVLFGAIVAMPWL